MVQTMAKRSRRQQALASLDRLPPFSPVLDRLLATIASEDVSFAEIGLLVENDTVLAANVLRLVNSALYGFQGTVNSVRHGLAILGVTRLRNLALSLSMARLWTGRAASGWSPAAFNTHSVACGILADLLAQETDVPYPEGAFVAGLLHDIGKMLLATSVPAEYAEIERLMAAQNRSVEECEFDVIGTTHSELSGLALRKWNVPQPIARAAAFHHRHEEAGAPPQLAETIWRADRLAAFAGDASPSYFEDPEDRSCLERETSEPRMHRLLDIFALEFGVLKAFL